MVKYFLHLSYKGTHYRGWQRQKSVISVQETIESAFLKMMKKNVAVIGCGRTDAEVHASQFIAHFSIEKLPEYDIVERLNLILPNDIAIHDIKEVREQAHAQFDALSRTYTYFIHHKPSPFLSEFSSYYPNSVLQLGKIIDALKEILKTNDFRSLCISPDTYKHTVCRLSHVKLLVNANEERLAFQITSNRFLRGMMRLLIGNLLAIGNGQIDASEFIEMVREGHQILPARYAHPQGLFLSSVIYPKTNFDIHPSHDLNALFSDPRWNKLL